MIHQRVFRVQVAEDFLARLAPIHTSMLLTSSRYSLNLLERRSLLLQPLQDQIQSFQPHGYGSIHGMVGLVNMDTFLDAIFGEVGVEVCFGFIENFQV